MSNNSSFFPFVHKFDDQLSCVTWHLQNKTISYSYARAVEVCSVYKDLAELGTGTAVISWLIALFIIISNAAVLVGILPTRELHKPIYFYLANLAMSDVVGGIGIIYRTVVEASVMKPYSMMKVGTFLLYGQMISASALSLLSIDSYIAIRHPMYHRTHAGTAKRNAGLAIVSTWLVLTLLIFSQIMGWNCLDMHTSNCFFFFHLAFLGVVGTMLSLMIIIMSFTNISIFIAIKKRQKRKLGQPGGAQPNQGHQSHNAAQDAANRKFQKSVHKARTVLIHVGIAFLFSFLSILFVVICIKNGDNCPYFMGPHARAIFMTANSAINPISSIIRTPKLRQAIWENLTFVPRLLCAVIRTNRENQQSQDEQDRPRIAIDLQGGPTRRSEQNIPTNQPVAARESKRNVAALPVPSTAGLSNGREIRENSQDEEPRQPNATNLQRGCTCDTDQNIPTTPAQTTTKHRKSGDNSQDEQPRPLNAANLQRGDACDTDHQGIPTIPAQATTEHSKSRAIGVNLRDEQPRPRKATLEGGGTCHMEQDIPTAAGPTATEQDKSRTIGENSQDKDPSPGNVSNMQKGVASYKSELNSSVDQPAGQRENELISTIVQRAEAGGCHLDMPAENPTTLSTWM